MRSELLWVPFLSLVLTGAAGCSRSASGSEGEKAGMNSAMPAAPLGSQDLVVKIAPASLPYLDVEPVNADAEAPAVRAPGRVAFRDGAMAEVAWPCCSPTIFPATSASYAT